MLCVPASIWEEVASHALEVYPEECCGALLGAKDRVERLIRLANSSETDRRRRYRIDPAELLDATQQARKLGMDVLTVYHSHPDSEAYFSPEDAANACPWYRYLVVAVRDGQIRAAKSYQWDAARGSYVECEFKIESPASAE
ncbi:MAG: M67 family metallopeptidase [Acidobacteriales bacterium]|nr:M67 family metallopeptidase [Terriglobales bacterium]